MLSTAFEGEVNSIVTLGSNFRRSPFSDYSFGNENVDVLNWHLFHSLTYYFLEQNCLWKSKFKLGPITEYFYLEWKDYSLVYWGGGVYDNPSVLSFFNTLF